MLMYSVKNFCTAHGIGTTMFYKQIAEGKLLAVKIGRKTLVREEDAKSWRNNLAPIKSA